MEAKDTDIFISYRRVDGRDIARSIQLALGKEGFGHVFFDYSSMREGMFNEQITTAINHCKDYILVLSPQSMLRCGDPEDWVAKELQTAIEAGCKIIPVQINEPFDAWPQDFPRKFNFIKQIEFLTLRTDEYFPDSIRRLIGWLDSKPTRVQEKQEEFTLTVHVDETCELYVNGSKVRKIKGGKFAVLNNLKRGQTYQLKFASLAQRNSEMEVEYNCPNEGPETGDITVSFIDARKQKQQQTEQQRTASVRAKEQAYQQRGRLMQACENYDENWNLRDGMMAVSLKGKIGFLDENGFEAVACEYDDATDFHGDYATVCKNGKWGIIDKIGQVVVSLQSDTPCWPHKNFKYFVASQNNRYAISTINNGFPASFPYEEVAIIKDINNVFAVKTGGLWHFTDLTGVASPFTLQVKSIGGRCSYFTLRKEWKNVYTYTPIDIQHPVTGRWGCLNSQLKLTVPFVDEGSNENVGMSSLEIIKTNGRMGLVNVETGEFLIPTIYENIRHIYQNGNTNYFRVADGATASNRSFDKQGNITSEDTRNLWGGKQGVVDVNGRIIVPQHYQHVFLTESYSKQLGDYVPVFLGYLLKDLQLSWGHPLLGSTYVNKKFNEQQSAIHIYAADGNILKKTNYTFYSYELGEMISKLINGK